MTDLKVCDMCGTKIENGKCSCRTWKNAEEMNATCDYKNPIEEWIDVEDRLPEKFIDILAYCVSLKKTDTFNKDEEYFSLDTYCTWNDGYPDSFRTDRFFPAKVIYWRYLPKGPKDHLRKND